MSTAQFDAHVSLPVSYIKAPGNLLKDKKDPDQVKTNSKFIKKIFQNSNEKTCSTLFSLTSYRTPRSETSDQYTVTDGAETVSAKEIHKLVIMDEDGQMSVIQMTKRILLTYGIELIVDISPKAYQQTIDALKLIASEVCSFHRQFFEKIKLSQLIICQKGNSRNISSKTNVIIVDGLIDTEKQISDALYKIIFLHLSTNNLPLIYEWKETEKIEGNDLLYLKEDSLSKLEESFIALMAMKNISNRSLKLKIQKAQELLVKYYPKEMSLEWFGNRRKDRKKVLRVSFLF